MKDSCRILSLSALILFASCEKEAPPDPDPDPPVVDCPVQVSETKMVVRVTVHGKGSGSLDLSHTFAEPDTNHAIPVYGLYDVPNRNHHEINEKTPG